MAAISLFGIPIWPPWRHVKTLYTIYFTLHLLVLHVHKSRSVLKMALVIFSKTRTNNTKQQEMLTSKVQVWQDKKRREKHTPKIKVFTKNFEKKNTNSHFDLVCAAFSPLVCLGFDTQVTRSWRKLTNEMVATFATEVNWWTNHKWRSESFVPTASLLWAFTRFLHFSNTASCHWLSVNKIEGKIRCLFELGTFTAHKIILSSVVNL